MSKQLSKMLFPKLRFPEFRGVGEWEEKPLFKVCEINPPVDGLPNKFIYIDLESVVSGSLLFKKEITKNDASSRAQRLLKNGDVIYQMVRPYQKNNLLCDFTDGNKYVASTGYAQLRSFDSSNFLYQAIHSVAFVDEVLAKSTGSNYPAINSKDLAKIGVIIPKAPEQQKIADCLSSIDKLITSYTQKHEALKAHKKGLMQQLFPAEGKTVPKLRFPEFQNAGEWKIKPMEKLFTIGNGKDHKHLPDGEIPVYGSGGYMRSVNEYLYEGESACIGRKGTIDKPVFLSGKFWTVDTLFYTHSFKDCLPKFVYLIFQNLNWRSHNEASGVPSLSKANINKIEVAVPKPSEQQKISELISSIDDLITVQGEKNKSLKDHKKGLIQQLFPTADEVNG